MTTPLSLSLSDQRRLSDTTTALLSPLLYSDADAWHRFVCERVRDLLGADKVMILMPRDGEVSLFTDDFDATISEYPARFQAAATAFGVFPRLRALGAGNRKTLFGDLEGYYSSSYWTDFGSPHRAYDGLVMSATLGPEPTLAHHAQIVVNHDSPHTAPFGDKGVALARLLIPALHAGALAWIRLARSRDAVASLIEALGIGALVFDADGAELYRNPTAARLLGADPDDLASVAARMARALTRPGPDGPPGPICTGRLVARAVPLAPEVAGRDGLALVTVELAGAPSGNAPDPDLARPLLGLTRRQARVAVLLASRRSTAEIAEALSISVHTVRRHTEAVLNRLEIKSRAEIEGVLRGVS